MKKIVPLTLLVCFFMLMSCVSRKDIIYLSDLQANQNSNFKWSDVVVQPNDILSIKITTEDLDLAIPYNISAMQQSVQGTQLLLQGYLVSNEGMVNLPVLGEVEVKELTYTQIEEKIQKELVQKKETCQDPLEFDLLQVLLDHYT